MGLATNIIDGVSAVMDLKGHAIVVEDDIIVGPQFLDYMNVGLRYYKNDESIWHINGFSEDIGSESYDDSFYWRAMRCWGWATWSDRWRYFEKNPQELVAAMGRNEITRFNLDGRHNFWGQVLENLAGNIDTWAIFWYATIFQRGGYCVRPVVSHTLNIGGDRTGTHSVDDGGLVSRARLNESGVFKPPIVSIEDDEIIDQVINRM